MVPATLRAYFPEQLRERFDAELDTHPLRREIIATVVANDMINLGGITFAFRAMEETSATEVAVAKAFVALREVYELDIMVEELNELPASFPTEHWSTVHLDIRRLLDRAVRWLLGQGGASRPIAEIVAEFKPLMDPMRARLLDYLRGDDRARVAGWLEKARGWDLPEDLAHRWAELFESFVLLDIAKIVHASKESVEDIAARLLHGVQPLPCRFPAGTDHQAAAGRTAGRRWPGPPCVMTSTPPFRT